MDNESLSGKGTAVRHETLRALFAVSCFSVSLGATTVIYPLLALEAGFAVSMVGIFTAASAVTQLLTRFLLPWLLALVSPRTAILAATVLLTLSGSILLFSTSLAAFLAAQASQGVGRALFWTGSQVHAVRGDGSPVRRLAQITMSSKIGSLVGPGLAGTLGAISLEFGLIVTVAGGAIATAAACVMTRRPPYRREPRSARRTLWRRRDVAGGYWTSFVAGGWRGLLDSYVPVVLAIAGFGSAPIGWLVTTAECSPILASGWLTKSPNLPLKPLAHAAGGTMLLGVAVLPLVTDSLVAAGLALALAGFGAGLATTVGPAMVNQYAFPSEQATVLAVTGAYRAVARMISPMAVAGAGVFIGIPVAMVAVTVCIVVPVHVANGVRGTLAEQGR